MDDTAGMTAEQKRMLDKVILERKLELIAEKRLRALEKKYAPKEKKSASDTFAKIKAYRQKNLARRKQRFMENEMKIKKWKSEYGKPGVERKAMSTRERIMSGK